MAEEEKAQGGGANNSDNNNNNNNNNNSNNNNNNNNNMNIIQDSLEEINELARKESFLRADDILPTNVSSEDQLSSIPSACRSGKKDRPLRHVHESGEVSFHALQPLFYSVIFILLIELLERFSFYGVNYTLTAFLTGEYDDEWNAGFNAVQASSYVSLSTAVAYTTPFVGAFLADSVIGDYWSLLLGSLCFYIPGLLLITLCTIPNLLGETFNTKVMTFALLGLWPTGTGLVKSIVNVFGAKQYHPILQSSLIESYYVNFYMCINIGALVGGVAVPIIAQSHLTFAYTLPVLMLALGVLSFSLGTTRYVRLKPTGNLFAKRIDGDQSIGLRSVLLISVLVIPFNIAYSQMSTTFIVQGTVMQKAFGFIDAASMNNADAIAVLVFGYFVGSVLYPWLSDNGIKIPTTYKFAIGSFLGALAIAWAQFVEYKIHSTFQETGEKVSILWQAMSYILIGAGEIFAVSAAYEAAYVASPPDKKALASSVNLFCVGGIPNVFCIGLYYICRKWFWNSSGNANIHRIEDYTTANVNKYFFVLLLISIMGVILNLLPPVRDFVAKIEEKADEMLKTPILMKRPKKKKLLHDEETLTDTSDDDDENDPLLRVRRHHEYLKYGSGPMLTKAGSMRAGPSFNSSIRSGNNNNNKPGNKPKKPIKRGQISKLYHSETLKPVVVKDANGRPIRAGKMKRQMSG